jgi:hypothetical protein
MTFTFNPSRGLIVVPARIHGPSGDTVVRLALDTGASVTMVNWDPLVLVGYDPASLPDRVQMTTGSGVEFVPRVGVSRVDALGVKAEGLEVICHTLPPSSTVDGVLGLDFFRGKRLVIDFRAGTVEID